MDYSSLFAGPTAAPQSLFGNGMGASPLMSLFGGGGNPQAMQMMQGLFSAGAPSAMPHAPSFPMMGGPQFFLNHVNSASMPLPGGGEVSNPTNPYGQGLKQAFGALNNRSFAPFRQMQQL